MNMYIFPKHKRYLLYAIKYIKHLFVFIYIENSKFNFISGNNSLDFIVTVDIIFQIFQRDTERNYINNVYLQYFEDYFESQLELKIYVSICFNVFRRLLFIFIQNSFISLFPFIYLLHI